MKKRIVSNTLSDGSSMYSIEEKHPLWGWQQAYDDFGMGLEVPLNYEKLEDAQANMPGHKEVVSSEVIT